MSYYNIIGLSEGIYTAKSNNIKECIVCHYWSFNHAFKFQNSVCNGCHNLTMLVTLPLSLLKVLIIAVLFMTLANPTQFICQKILCFMILGIYKIHMKEIKIKSRVYYYYFDNLEQKN